MFKMNKKRYSELLFLVILIGVLAVFAYAEFADQSISVVSPAADTNYSGSLVLNVTLNNTYESNATNVTFFFYNADSGTLVYNVTFENSTTNQTIFNSTVATATFLTDGTYNLTVNATNSSDINIFNDTIATIQIDNTAPLVTINTANNTFIGTSPTSLVFNVTVTDSGSGVLTTIDLQNNSASNESASQVGSASEREFNRTVVVAELAEGSNTLTVVANDTITAANGGINSNNSESIIVWLDTTAPTIGLVSPPNATWVGTLGQYTFNFSDGSSPNASCELFIDEASYGINSTTLNDTNTVLTPNASIAAGIHNWYVNCTDLGANVGTNINIDAYDVLDVNVTAPTNASYTSSTDAGNVSFQFNYLSSLNITSDLLNNNVSCELFVTNSSGDYLAMGVNETALNNTVMTITNNQSLLSDLTPNGASANWTANCTYNSTTIGVNTGFYTLFVDNVTPTVTASSSSVTTTSATLTATTSEAATCRYGTTDSWGSMSTFTTTSGTSHTTSAGSLSSGTTYTQYVRCQDSALNEGSASTSFTTTSSSSGTGAGGASSGISTGVTGTSGKRVWTSLNKGETAKVPIKNGALGVTNVEFDISETVYGVWFRVAKIDSFPSSVKGFEKNIYRKIDVSKSTNLKDDLISKGNIDFKVEKAWLTEKGLTKENIALFRYNNDVWNQLNTVLGTDDGQYIHFSAKTPGFSYFLIGERVEGNVPETVGQAAGTEPAVEKPVPGATTEPVTEAPVRSQPVWPWAVLALIVIVAGVWFWMSKKK